jgi:hypothetical protein
MLSILLTVAATLFAICYAVKATSPNRLRRRSWFGWLAFLSGLGALASHLLGCTAQQGATAGGIIGSLDNAICTELDTQPEPAWVVFACNVLDPTGKTAGASFQVKVKQSDAPAFAGGHCPKTASAKAAP